MLHEFIPLMLAATYVLICIILCVLVVRWARHSEVIRYLKFRREFRKKCLNTTPCQCCAYWNVRKEYCALEMQLLQKHNLPNIGGSK